MDELRTNSSKGSGAFLDAAMMLMWSHSFEDCIDGFSHPNKEDCGVDELIDDFINLRDVDIKNVKAYVNYVTESGCAYLLASFVP